MVTVERRYGASMWHTFYSQGYEICDTRGAFPPLTWTAAAKQGALPSPRTPLAIPPVGVAAVKVGLVMQLRWRGWSTLAPSNL